MQRLLWLFFFISCHIVVSQGGQAGNTPSNEPVAKTNTSSAPRLNKSVHASAVLEELKQDTLFLIGSIGVFGAAILCLCLSTCVLGCQQTAKAVKPTVAKEPSVSPSPKVPPVVNDVESVASKRDSTTSTADGHRLSKQETLEKEGNDGHYEDCSFSKPVTPKHTEA
ncbi:unnamed protein product, partial [Mesorhabditis spiculigera]